MLSSFSSKCTGSISFAGQPDRIVIVVVDDLPLIMHDLEICSYDKKKSPFASQDGMPNS